VREGKPFFFPAPLAAVEGLRACRRVDNDNALAFGDDPLKDTLALLRDASIAGAGARRASDANDGRRSSRGVGARVGLLAMTDHLARKPQRQPPTHSGVRAVGWAGQCQGRTTGGP
jgi:hypothetical protein